MKVQQMHSRVWAYLSNRMRNTIVPATAGIGLTFTACYEPRGMSYGTAFVGDAAVLRFDAPSYLDGGAPDGGISAVLPLYSAADVAAVLAQCDLAHGPAASPATYGDKRALMVGTWIACPPYTITVFSPGIVFAADGTFQRLLSDGTGGLVLGWGADNQGTYSFPSHDNQPTNGNPYVTVAAANQSDLPIAFGDGPLTLETSPSRMHTIITYNSQDIELWLVRIP